MNHPQMQRTLHILKVFIIIAEKEMMNKCLPFIRYYMEITLLVLFSSVTIKVIVYPSKAIGEGGEICW